LSLLQKKDMVEEEWLEMVTEEIEEFCSESFLEGAPIIHVSSVTGEGSNPNIAKYCFTSACPKNFSSSLCIMSFAPVASITALLPQT